MKVALLGPEGTYTHQAAEEYFEELEPVFCSSIREVFESDIDVKFVPVENSLGGGVSDTMDLLREMDENITGEKTLEINHCLVSSEESIEDVEKVVSHPQALAQSKEFINSNDLEKQEANSTASAAENLEEGEAALSSEITAELYDLNILEKGVQDVESNVTRFFVLNSDPGNKQKTSFMLEPSDDRPGLLSNMLSCFSGHGINLSHIQSLPKKTRLGEYCFYVEAEESDESENMRKAVECLKTYCEVENLGSYEADTDA
jgi:chorismate mutase/prephenate dehydratase